jgi:hypothetical protein
MLADSRPVVKPTESLSQTNRDITNVFPENPVDFKIVRTGSG